MNRDAVQNERGPRTSTIRKHLASLAAKGGCGKEFTKTIQSSSSAALKFNHGPAVGVGSGIASGIINPFTLQKLQNTHNVFGLCSRDSPKIEKYSNNSSLVKAEEELRETEDNELEGDVEDDEIEVEDQLDEQNHNSSSESGIDSTKQDNSTTTIPTFSLFGKYYINSKQG